MYDFRYSSLDLPQETVDPEIDGVITSGENRKKLRRILQKVEKEFQESQDATKINEE